MNNLSILEKISQYSFLLTLFLTSYCHFNSLETPLYLDFEKLKIYINYSSDIVDKRILHKKLYYPKAKVKYHTTYSEDPFFQQEEVILILSSTDDINRIYKYYIKLFRNFKWQIIQKKEKDDYKYIVAENIFKRLFTLIIRKGTIKLYVRSIN